MSENEVNQMFRKNDFIKLTGRLSQLFSDYIYETFSYDIVYNYLSGLIYTRENADIRFTQIIIPEKHKRNFDLRSEYVLQRKRADIFRIEDYQQALNGN